MSKRIARRFAGKGRVPMRRLEAYILADAGFIRKAEALLLRRINLGVLRPEMCPRPGPPDTWRLPALTTEGELGAWLGITPAELDWLADCKGLERTARAEPLRNYIYACWPGCARTPRRAGCGTLVHRESARPTT